MLLRESRLVAPLKAAAKASPADETLMAVQRGGQTTLRFSGGQIYQNFHEESTTLWIKVACQGKMGVATTSSLSPESLRKAIKAAVTIARVCPKQTPPAFSTTPPQRPTPKLTSYFPSTTGRPLTETVQTIRKLSSQSNKIGIELAGSFVVGEEELAVVGSKGLVQYQPFSIAGLRLVATQGKASGFASQVVRDIEKLDPESLSKRAWDHCRLNRNPKPIPIGKYDVLLEPEAVAELVEWLSGIGFGAKQFFERTSFMTGRIGERLMSPKISIFDDGSDAQGLSVPFDYEGVPKERVALIEKGVAQNFVYDSHFAKLHHRPSTGHALSYDEFEGPMALNLFVNPGDTPANQLLKGMSQGLWISRFHYVNGLLDTRQALMTGLTRDGTFIVKDGRVVGAAKNLRFTQSILEAFSKVVGVSQERKLVADPSQGLSAVVTPALLIRGFTFTGQTK